MLLLIDPSPTDQVNLYLHMNTNWIHAEFSVSEPLLVNIDKFLKQQNIKVADLSGVGVLIGRGRFTSTRIAITIANTLAYLLKIPVVAVKEIDWEKLSGQIIAAPVGQYAAAIYSGEANIGGKKNHYAV